MHVNKLVADLAFISTDTNITDFLGLYRFVKLSYNYIQPAQVNLYYFLKCTLLHLYTLHSKPLLSKSIDER